MSDELQQFEAALLEHGAELSEAGRERRQAMRTQVVATAGMRRHSGLKWGLAAAAVLIISALWSLFGTVDIEPGGANDIVYIEPLTESFAHLDVTRLGDDPSVLARYRVDESSLSLTVDRVGDAELVVLLASAGHQTGIIHMGGATVLTTPLPEREAAEAKDKSSAD